VLPLSVIVAPSLARQAIAKTILAFRAVQAAFDAR
jgi:hypothetical protein